mmetsp:Transcript_17415/g.26834  ORF Transcript_17415/g.26834 Transcript_17415/m.26834 type:complete len:129 (-) Transcript_17415:193-579(-)
MKRELASKLYTPTTYIIGRFISSVLLQIGYPFIMVMFLFWGIGIETTPQTWGMIFLIAVAGNFVFAGQGFVVGLVVDNEDSCKIVNQLLAMVIFSTAGGVANIGTMNWLIKFLSKISPGRFVTESMTR